jgi:hypothetical protein
MTGNRWCRPSLATGYRAHAPDNPNPLKGTECLHDLLIARLVAAGQNTALALVVRNEAVDQTLIGVQQPKLLVELVEIDVVDHSPR